jgi:sulfite reductase (NADPH) flavoprotein alpha-component
VPGAVFAHAPQAPGRRARQGGSGAAAGWIVAYASQTGNAEELAQQTAAT